MKFTPRPKKLFPQRSAVHIVVQLHWQSHVVAQQTPQGQIGHSEEVGRVQHNAAAHIQGSHHGHTAPQDIAFLYANSVYSAEKLLQYRICVLLCKRFLFLLQNPEF